MSMSSAAGAMARNAASTTASGGPANVTTVRLVALPASTWRRGTPSIVSMRAVIFRRPSGSRPSLKLGTHSINADMGDAVSGLAPNLSAGNPDAELPTSASMPLTPPDTTPATAAPSKDLRYTIAVIAAVAGVGWMVEFPESFAHTPFLVAGAAGALVLLFGGMPGIIFTQVVTLLATIWFVIPPTHSFRIAELGDVGRLGIFVTLFAIADVLSWRLEKARARAAERERSVRESEARHRLILERASDGLVVSAPDGRIELVNPRLCKILNYPRDELLRLPVPSLFAPGEAEPGD